MYFRPAVGACALLIASVPALSQNNSSELDTDTRIESIEPFAPAARDIDAGSGLETAPLEQATEPLPEAELDYTPLPTRQRLLEPVPSADIPIAMVTTDDVDAMSNDDVIQMLRAEFGEATILAAMEANRTAFDVSPRQLVALKRVGVPETVIEAMLAAEARNQQASEQRAVEALADDVVEPADLDEGAEIASDSVEMLSRALERLANEEASDPVQATPGAPEPSAPVASSAPPVVAAQAAPPTKPRAWAVQDDARHALAPTVAQVAFTDAKSGTAANALKTLESLSSRKALAFASPALAVANEIGGLFRSNDPTTTAVWALSGATSSRRLQPGGELEIEFGNIPGVNPDEYRPAVVQLVPTIDNFRVVGAAKTKVSDLDAGIPTDPIIEETVAARAKRLERGRYRIELGDSMPPGEYALVLRPTERDKRRRRKEPTSLGELLGSGASDVLYMTWDFSIGDGPPLL